MSKLDRKPTEKRPLLGWKDLNLYLQFHFTSNDKENTPPFYVMDPNLYSMTKEEIISEGQKNNYNVKENEDGTLTFT